MNFFAVIKNTLWQSIARLFSSFIGFLITIIIASHFGVLGYGDFVKITSFVAPFYLLIDFGLNAFYLQLENKQYSKLFWLRIYIAFITFALINFINLFLPYDSVLNSGYSPSVKMGIFIFSFSAFSQAIIFSSLAVFQERLRYLSYMVSIILGSIINIFLVLIMALSNNQINYVILAFVLSGFSTALLAAIFLKEKISMPKVNYLFSKKLLIESFPLALMLFFNLIYFRIDSIILALLKSTGDVGIYGLSYKFFDFLIALPLFLSNSLYPILLQNQKNYRKLKLIIRNYSLVFLFFGIVLIIPFWFFSPFFSLIKEDFVKSVLPFRILLLSLPFFFISSFLQWVLISFKDQKFLTLIYFVCAVFNIVLNLIFIPQYSYIAAAIITIASEGLVVLLLLIRLILQKNIRTGAGI